ncbi:hypothetical protein [Nitrosomonas ureae]|uniref:hypothetical protein n=1 Tax=Nitrosomonas ureae TaxID=44577 RepID=UPI00114150C2|nr:hypothetical protein [Nitrosomonas ureae]
MPQHDHRQREHPRNVLQPFRRHGYNNKPVSRVRWSHKIRGRKSPPAVKYLKVARRLFSWFQAAQGESGSFDQYRLAVAS